jgi:purine-nucleoside phosphorylase
VLMPGDPYRAKWAAETFLKDAVCVNQVRGMLGFTGTWRGHPVTIQGSGMGMPSLSIYANELIRDYGAKTLIRIGSAGAMQAHVKIRDVVIAMTASSLSTPSRAFFREAEFAPAAATARSSSPKSAASCRRTCSTTNGPTCRKPWPATASSASRWRRPSFTPSPPATARGRWPS